MNASTSPVQTAAATQLAGADPRPSFLTAHQQHRVLVTAFGLGLLVILTSASGLWWKRAHAVVPEKEGEVICCCIFPPPRIIELPETNPIYGSKCYKYDERFRKPRASFSFVPPAVVPDKDFPPENYIYVPPKRKMIAPDTMTPSIIQDAPIPRGPIDTTAKSWAEYEAEIERDSIYEVSTVQYPPIFMGGDTSLRWYVRDRFKYSPETEEIQGTVIVEFVVEKSGVLSHFKTLKTPGGGLDQILIHALREMPRWQSGQIDGQPVRTRFRFPMRIRLE